MLLIVSRPDDEHVEHVIPRLAERGIPYHAVDPRDFPADARVAVSRGDPAAPRIRIAGPGGPVTLDAVRAVWYRRPRQPVFDTAMSDDAGVRRWADLEIGEFVDGLMESLDCLWIPGPPTLAFRAQHKLYHLGVAEHVGFRVPRTVVTNDWAAARAFRRAVDGEVVSKAVLRGQVEIGGELRACYTRPVLRRALRWRHTLRYVPATFQEYVPKRIEVRVTVFGSQVFAAELDSQASRFCRYDWRYMVMEDIAHRPHQLPDAIERQCLGLVRALGLTNGAIDLVVTPAGEYVFLEINPFGQWLWIEEWAGLPLTDALLALVESAVKRPAPALREPR